MAHGKICYLEIPANRAEDAATLHSTIFGWTCAHVAMATSPSMTRSTRKMEEWCRSST